MKHLNYIIILYIIVFIFSVLGIILFPLYAFNPITEKDFTFFSLIQILTIIGEVILFGGCIFGVFKSIYEIHENINYKNDTYCAFSNINTTLSNMDNTIKTLTDDIEKLKNNQTHETI